MNHMGARVQLKDKGTRTRPAAPGVRARAGSARSLASPARAALPSGPAGGLAGTGLDGAAVRRAAAFLPYSETAARARDRHRFDLARCQPRDVSPVIAQGAASQAILFHCVVRRHDAIPG